MAKVKTASGTLYFWAGRQFRCMIVDGLVGESPERSFEMRPYQLLAWTKEGEKPQEIVLDKKVLAVDEKDALVRVGAMLPEGVEPNDVHVIANAP